MKWFRNHCRRREDSSLLAVDILAGDEKIAAERHLAECGECRTHYSELRRLTASLAGSEKTFSLVEPSPAMRTRWAEAVKGAAPALSKTSRSSTLGARILDVVWSELIWPSRYAWSGLAALWLAMLIVNARLSDHGTHGTPASPQDILEAWQEQRRIFADWDRPSVIVRATPVTIPRPRSQRDAQRAVI